LFVGLSATNKEAVYDIEFLGGTSVQLDLQPGQDLSDEDVADAITAADGANGPSAVQWLLGAADALTEAEAGGGSTPSEFTLTSSNPAATPRQLGILMHDVLEDDLERDGTTVVDGDTVAFVFKTGDVTLETFKQSVAQAVAQTRQAASQFRGARVQTVSDLEAGEEMGASFEIVTIVTNRALVQEAILATMGDKLRVQQAVRLQRPEDDGRLGRIFVEGFDEYELFVVEEDAQYLRDIVGGDAAYDVRRFRGGAAIKIQLHDDEDPLPVAELERRLREVALQLDAEHYRTRETRPFPLGAGTPETGYKAFAILAVDESVLYEDKGVDVWQETFAAPLLKQARAALAKEKSLSKVVQFAPQIAGQTQNRAAFAIILALAAIVCYLWLRFGNKEFGLAAIVALVHDVSVTLGLVALSRYIAGSIVGDVLAIDAFRVDLPMIAAVLTVIGYSLNDTIVVFDRIRENRGRIGALSAKIINNSINQTLSRTLLTSITTFVVVAVLYCFGGSGVHGFSYALLIGVVVGTYSTIGIATPLLYKPRILHGVIIVIVALALVGLTFLATDNRIAELIVIAIIVVAAGVAMVKSSSAGDYAGAGRPATA
jgi:preprotein translocase SecF subunit